MRAAGRHGAAIVLAGDIRRVGVRVVAGGDVRRRRGQKLCPRTRVMSPAGADCTRPRGMSPAALSLGGALSSSVDSSGPEGLGAGPLS